MAGNTGGMPLFRFMCLRALFMNRSVKILRLATSNYFPCGSWSLQPPDFIEVNIRGSHAVAVPPCLCSPSTPKATLGPQPSLDACALLNREKKR